MVTTTGLNKTQKAKVREGLRKRIKSKFYKKGHVSKMARAAAKTGRKVAAAKTKKKSPVIKVKDSLKGKFTSKAHASKWGVAKKKQLNALKRAGKLSADQHKAKMGKVTKRIAHGKKKKYS